MKTLLMGLYALCSVSVFANSVDILTSEITGNGMFKVQYESRGVGTGEYHISSATGMGVRDTFKSCKEFPCEICAIEEFKTIESRTGRCSVGACGHAVVEVTLKGLNCGTP